MLFILLFIYFFVEVNLFSWCSKQKLDFLSVEQERKIVKRDKQKIRFRLLSVLEDNYHGNAKMTYLYETCAKIYFR